MEKSKIQPIILFLDKDGPLIPVRSYVNGYSPRIGLRGNVYYFDEMMVKKLNMLGQAYEYKIVFNSAHNGFGKELARETAIINGIEEHLLHEDIITDFPHKAYTRYDGITCWIAKNGPTPKWLVIDDEKVYDGLNQIRPSLYHGMTETEYSKLNNIMRTLHESKI